MRTRDNPTRDIGYQLSRLCFGILAVLFVLGIGYGALEYASRARVAERHVAGTNAITVHALIAVAAALIVAGIQVWRSRRPALRGPSPWAAPFSAAAMARLRRTTTFSRGLSPANLARVIVAVPLVLVMAYAPLRMGAQITSGLDPSATVNAWGGPSYPGALLAHWLDCVVGFYAAAFLLSRVLLPAAQSRPGRSAARDATTIPVR